MKLYWHIGPHKTGTTSLQTAMAARAASGRASYYYPPVGLYGPGHAVLAWQFLGLNKRTKTPDVLEQEIESAHKQGYSQILLSSEEFSRALLTEDSFRQFGRICEQVDCELIITLRPLPVRLWPELQELIKNGQKLDISNAQDVLQAIMMRPGLRPDFLSAAINETKASSITIIEVDGDSPTKVFLDMATVIGEQLPVPRHATVNRSYPFIKTAWLDAVNRYGSLTLSDAREVVEAAFAAGSRHAASLGEIAYPPLPAAVQRYTQGVWDLQKAYLEELRSSGRIRLL